MANPPEWMPGVRVPIPEGWSLTAPKEPGLYRIAVRDGEIHREDGPTQSKWLARLYHHDERGLSFDLEGGHDARANWIASLLKYHAVWGPRVDDVHG